MFFFYFSLLFTYNEWTGTKFSKAINLIVVSTSEIFYVAILQHILIISMVQIKSGGEVFSLNSGRQVAWSEVPSWFKRIMRSEEQMPTPCYKERDEAQKCFETDGFWSEICVMPLENFDTCQTRHTPTHD